MDRYSSISYQKSPFGTALGGKLRNTISSSAGDHRLHVNNRKGNLPTSLYADPSAIYSYIPEANAEELAELRVRCVEQEYELAVKNDELAIKTSELAVALKERDLEMQRQHHDKMSREKIEISGIDVTDTDDFHLLSPEPIDKRKYSENKKTETLDTGNVLLQDNITNEMIEIRSERDSLKEELNTIRKQMLKDKETSSSTHDQHQVIVEMKKEISKLKEDLATERVLSDRLRSETADERLRDVFHLEGMSEVITQTILIPTDSIFNRLKTSEYQFNSDKVIGFQGNHLPNGRITNTSQKSGSSTATNKRGIFDLYDVTVEFIAPSRSIVLKGKRLCVELIKGRIYGIIIDMSNRRSSTTTGPNLRSSLPVAKRLESHADEVDNLSRTISTHETTIAALHTAIRHAQEKAASSTSKFEEMKSKMSSMEEELKHAQMMAMVRETELSTQVSFHDRVKEAAEEMSNQALKSLDDEAALSEKLREENVQLIKQIRELTASKQSQERRRAVAVNQVKYLSQKVNESTSDKELISNLTKLVEELRREKESTIMEFSKENGKLEAELKTLKESVESYRHATKEAKTQDQEYQLNAKNEGVLASGNGPSDARIPVPGNVTHLVSTPRGEVGNRTNSVSFNVSLPNDTEKQYKNIIDQLHDENDTLRADLDQAYKDIKELVSAIKEARKFRDLCSKDLERLQKEKRQLTDEKIHLQKQRMEEQLIANQRQSALELEITTVSEEAVRMKERCQLMHTKFNQLQQQRISDKMQMRNLNISKNSHNSEMSDPHYRRTVLEGRGGGQTPPQTGYGRSIEVSNNHHGYLHHYDVQERAINSNRSPQYRTGAKTVREMGELSSPNNSLTPTTSYSYGREEPSDVMGMRRDMLSQKGDNNKGSLLACLPRQQRNPSLDSCEKSLDDSLGNIVMLSPVPTSTSLQILADGKDDDRSRNIHKDMSIDNTDWDSPSCFSNIDKKISDLTARYSLNISPSRHGVSKALSSGKASLSTTTSGANHMSRVKYTQPSIGGGPGPSSDNAPSPKLSARA